MLSGNTVKYIQSLTHKKFRDQYRRFIVETPKVVDEFLTSGYKVDALYVTEECQNSMQDKWSANKDSIIKVKDYELEKISRLKTSREVVGIFHIPESTLPVKLNGEITLALDDIQDPGNMGTIIRVADWFGIQQILCSRHTVNVYSPKVIQASMGSLARVKVYYLDLEPFLKSGGLPVYAASLDGTSVFESGKVKEGILVIGNEGKGISENILTLASHRITIPRIGKAESLNAAMATGIILSHLVSV